MTAVAQKIWLIIPAAGQGIRFNHSVPKQYLLINNKTIIEHTLSTFSNVVPFNQTMVVLSPQDKHWQALQFAHKEQIKTAKGGSTRYESVYNGLVALQNLAKTDDWVLVHDAVRPCVRVSDINKLIDKVKNHSVGGVLGLPVKDTLKRADNNQIVATVSRENLWHALTPQMFRYQPLMNALNHVIKNKIDITDEAQAMEISGIKPLLVEGSSTNIKITYPEDLKLAEQIIAVGI